MRSGGGGARTAARAGAAAVALVVVLVVAACGDNEVRNPLGGLGADLAKLASRRATVVGDLVVVRSAAATADAATRAVERGDVDIAASAVPRAAEALETGAPLAARGRSDVLSYEHAVEAVAADLDALGPGNGISADRLAALADLATFGSAEVDAARGAFAAYAPTWTRRSSLCAQQKTWLQRARNGAYGPERTGNLVAAQAYDRLVAGEAAQRAIDAAQVAAALRVYDGAHATMDRAVAAAQEALAPLDLPPISATPVTPTPTGASAPGAG